MLRRVVSAVSIASLVLAGACTPRPDVADDAAEAFLTALSHNDHAGDQTDDPATATSAIQASYQGLDARGLDTRLDKVTTNGTTATAEYTLNWVLPGERKMRYPARMTLTKSSGEWTVRWQPTILHPDLGTNQHLELRSVPATPASVVGSDGAVLMEPGTTFRVLLDARKKEQIPATLAKIAATLDAMRATDPTTPRIDTAAAAQEAAGVNGEYSVVVLSQTQGAQFQEKVGALPDTLRLNEEPALVRPTPGFAPDILSRVGKIVEDDLKGTAGWKVVAATDNGAEVRKLEGAPPKPAPAVRLSLSKRVQEAAQQAVDTRGDAKAMMVVMRPSTGEVLAVAQTRKADADGNVALVGQYPPGSTFKIVTAYAGLNHEGLNPGSPVNCPGTQNIGGRIVTNYNGFSLGSTTLQQAFAASCNTTFARISSDLKPGELTDTAAQFGLGADFTIAGLDTVTGSVPRGEVLLDRTEAGYGQGLDLVSPFGMALTSASVAAGKMPVPYLIAGDEHRTSVAKNNPATLDPSQVNQLREMMRAVVTSGTATGVSGDGDVHGKTGEAEVNGGSHAWFTGYRGDLAFATLIVLGGGSGSAVNVTHDFFQRLGPDAPEDAIQAGRSET